MIVFHHADQRIPDRGVLPPPRTWDYVTRYRRPDGSFWAQSDQDLALCTCGNRHTCRLSGNVHAVAADGTVTPSYVCPVTGCSFHEWVQLDGWDAAHVYKIKEIS